MKKVNLKSILAALCLLLCLLFAGCGAEEEVQCSVLAENPVLTESSYTLGSTMGDYTLTDVNGNTHSFSDLLSTKKAIVLNFWFINCGPCQMEFPYMNEAYEKYKGDLEILAINPVGDSEGDIAAFAEEFGLTFPVLAGDMAWESAMSLQGYPTTVVVDRFGTVSLKHTGYIDSTETFSKIFEFFTAEDYTSTVVNSLSEIK